MTRIAETFSHLRQEKRVGLVAFLTVGFPDLASTYSLVPALVEGGVDIVELGVPFSDPLADGTTIQRASFKALEQGVTLKQCLEVAQELRRRGVKIPLVLMGYYNPVLSYGLEHFGKDCLSAGIDGVIVPDLPPEEAEPLWRVCRDNDMDLIFMLAPTSTSERIKLVSELASGFIYCVSLTGITGARQALPDSLPKFIERVRRHSKLPLAVGFGISTRSQIETIADFADAVIVGSALIDVIEKAPAEERTSRAKEYIAELRGNKRSNDSVA